MIKQLFNENNIIMNSFIMRDLQSSQNCRLEFAIPTDCALIRPHDKIKIEIFDYTIIATVESMYMSQQITTINVIVKSNYLRMVHPNNPEIEEIGRKILNAVQINWR